MGYQQSPRFLHRLETFRKRLTKKKNKMANSKTTKINIKWRKKRDNNLYSITSQQVSLPRRAWPILPQFKEHISVVPQLEIGSCTLTTATTTKVGDKRKQKYNFSHSAKCQNEFHFNHVTSFRLLKFFKFFVFMVSLFPTATKDRA